MQKLQNLFSLLSIEDAGRNTSARLLIITLEGFKQLNDGLTLYLQHFDLLVTIISNSWILRSLVNG
jgi:hypothetical protein